MNPGWERLYFLLTKNFAELLIFAAMDDAKSTALSLSEIKIRSGFFYLGFRVIDSHRARQHRESASLLRPNCLFSG